MAELKDINLESLPEFSHKGKLNQIFLNTLKEIQIELDLKPVISKVNIIYKEQDSGLVEENETVIDLGIKRVEKDGVLTLVLFEKYKEFLPYILLREAYYCFIPPKVKEIKSVKIAVNLLVEVRLSNLKSVTKWRAMIRERIVDYKYLAGDMEGITKFLSYQNIANPVKFILEYIRNTALTKNQEPEDFFEDVLSDFILKTSQILFRDDLIETLRILIKIFYKLKNYRALSDYQKYFKEFKKNKFITTELSLKRFSSNVQWIAKYGWISPNYHPNLPATGLRAIYYRLKFSPLLSVAKIIRCLKEMPFLLHIRYCLSNFSVEIIGYFLCPHYYENDIVTLFDKMENMGYIVEKNLYIDINIVGNYLNLNYFRDFYKKDRIINPYHKLYDKKYEIAFEE